MLIKADKKPSGKTTLAEAKKKLPEEKKLRAEKKFPKERNIILELDPQIRTKTFTYNMPPITKIFP